MHQSKESQVQLTFADLLFNILLEYTRLQLKERSVTASMFADAFIGSGKYGKSLIKRTSQTAIRLQIPVFKKTTALANGEMQKFVFAMTSPINALQSRWMTL